MFGRGFSSTLKLFQSFTPQIDRTFPGHMNTVIFKVVFYTLKVPTAYTSKMKEGRWHIPQRNIWGILVQKKHSVPIGFYFSPCVSMLVFTLLFKGSPACWRVHTHVSKLHCPSLSHRISVIEKRDAAMNQCHCQPKVQHKLSAGAFYINVHWNSCVRRVLTSFVLIFYNNFALRPGFFLHFVFIILLFCAFWLM